MASGWTTDQNYSRVLENLASFLSVW